MRWDSDDADAEKKKLKLNKFQWGNTKATDMPGQVGLKKTRGR